VCLFALGSALRFFSSPGNSAAADTLASVGEIWSPTFPWMLTQTDPASWNKNYTVAIAADYTGCDNSQVVAPGSAIWYWVPANCPKFGLGYADSQLLKSWQSVGAAAVIISDYDPAVLSSGETVPFGGAGSQTGITIPVQMFTFVNDIYGAKDENDPILDYIFYVSPNDNLTVKLSSPYISSLSVARNTLPSGWGFVVWFSLTLALIAFTLSVAKFAVFVSFEQGFKLSLPQICLGAACLSAGVLSMYLIFGPWFYCNANCNAMVYFSNVFVTIWVGAVFVFAFYLVEVTTISAVPASGAPLKRFKWPAIIVVAYLFVIEVITITLFSANVPNVDFTRINPLVGTSYIVSIGLADITLGVASFLVFRAMSTSGGNFKATAVRLMCFSVGIIVCSVFQMVYYGNAIIVGYLFNGYNFFCYMYSFYWMPPAVICILLAFNFRIAVSKEIEISKSGTSSTSSGSGSRSASSSSSSSQDPVIEL